MRIEITHVRYGSTPKTELTISQYQWREIDAPGTGAFGKHALIAWLETHQGAAYIRSGRTRVPVHVVGASQKYLRAQAAADAGDLTSLPEF